MSLHLPCFGSVSYWSKIASSSNPILSVNHTFQKQSSLSQYEIGTSQGNLLLSIPTLKSTRKKLYKDVEIAYNANWQQEQWRSIENAYLKSPFFLFYGYKIEPYFKSQQTHLLPYNLDLLKVICRCIKVNPPLVEYEMPMMMDRKSTKNLNISPYPQVFDNQIAFQPDLSILDLVFNLGPETKDYLRSL